MNIKFIPIDFDYFDYKGSNYVKLIGRTDKGKRICVIDSYEPHFWAIFKEGISEKRIEAIKKKVGKIRTENAGRKVNVLKVEVCDKKFLGKDVKALKVYITNHKDGHAIAGEMGFKEIEKRREYDLPMITRYINERGVSPMVWYDLKGEVLVGKEDFSGLVDSLEVDMCIRAEDIKKSKTQHEFKPRILAYDIETDEFELGKGSIILISLYGDGFKKVLAWKKCGEKQDYVECFKGEGDMLEAYVKYVKEYDADFLVGYFSDGFDLPYLRSSAARNKIKLSLGLDGTQPSFARGRIPSGRISGIVHIDIFRFIETAYAQYLQSETLSLNEVGNELLGEKKLDFSFSRLRSMSDSDWRDMFAYNLQDSAIAYKLAVKIWPDMLEMTKIVKEPLFNVTRAGLSKLVENYIIHNLDKFNEIAEKRPPHDEIQRRRAKGKFEGGYVLEPTPGLYHNLGIFDFTSMHTSIITSFNISKTTLLEKKEKDSYETPEINFMGEKKRFYFSKKQGFFPALLKEIFDKRKKFKREYKKQPNPITKARSNVFKLLSASVHGYQGFYGARYYSFEAASSVLAFVRKFNKEVIGKVDKEGYKTIYADTDSIAFLLNNKTKKHTLKFLEKLNAELPGIMELELEDFYKRGLFVSKRTTSAGAKKKYALISDDGKVKIRGFETVRRDWCVLARELQNKVLAFVLKDGDGKNALKTFKDVVKKLKAREVNKKKLLIKTQLKKAINEYIAQGPHVIAAKKMEAKGIPVSQGMVIEYFVAETREKKKLVREKVKLPDEKGEYNIEYYLNNQLIPAVENILEVFGVNLKEVVSGHRQEKLF